MESQEGKLNYYSTCFTNYYRYYNWR